MNPCYFGPEDRPLFGMYTPPRPSVAREAAVLLCAPIGLEYLRTHYAIRLLALQLADSGFHVLRFDYRGTGDSSGDIGPGQFGTWLDDVQLAARELRDISGAQSLTVVGMRMGAVLALETAGTYGLALDGLVLWDPVVDGDRYLEVLQRMHGQMASQRTHPARASDELLGAHYPADLRAAIQSVDIGRRLRSVDVKGAALVVSEDPSDYSVLLKQMSSRWSNLEYRLVADPVGWGSLKAAFDARMTGPVVRVVAEAVESLA